MREQGLRRLLRGWLGSRDGRKPADRAAMAKAALGCVSFGAVILLVSLALPDSPARDEQGLAVTAAIATMVAIGLALSLNHVSEWLLNLGNAGGAVIATAAIYFWGEDSLYGAVPYLLPALYASCFLSLRWAVVHIGFIGALLAMLLIVRDPAYTPLASWGATIGTVAAGAILVAGIRRRTGAELSSLADAALRDPLTGLLNRRGFEQAFDTELERARRTGQPLSVIVGDLDHFKELNDRFGHAAGDDALRRVGLAFSTGERSWDTAARVGGEEFAVIAPDTDEHGAYIISERVRTAIEESFAEECEAEITGSFGIVSFPVHGQTPGALLKAADQALYAAKRLGRNRSVISSAEVPGILARLPRDRAGVAVDLATLVSFAEALDVRDSGSSSHCQRVGRYAELIARELGLQPDTVERVRMAGVLHDVGRVGVPDELFTKAGPLTDDEWHWVRSHPEIGARMLETTDYAEIGDWILAHHERPDGDGYPLGRPAEELPLEAAILGVADAYQAMTAPRAHRPPLGPEVASEELRRGAGRQFDARVVDALLRVV